MKTAIHACILIAVAAAIACSNETATGPELPSFTDQQPFTTAISPPPHSPPAGIAPANTQCQDINITARRVMEVGTDYVIINVQAELEGVYVKVIDRETGVLLYRGELGTSIRIGGLFPDTSYTFLVFVEIDRDGVVQCDGTLHFRTKGIPPPPGCEGADCDPEPPCEEDCEPPPTCEELENCPPPPPPPPVCDVKTGNLSLRSPLGNPRDECRVTGDGVPGPPNDWWVMKCGLDYTVSFSKLDHCGGSDKDLSHATGCMCPAPQ